MKFGQGFPFFHLVARKINFLAKVDKKLEFLLKV
jgi:hypothetical protein